MKIIAIIQARMSSTRLPGKILLDLNGKPVLQNIVERIKRAKDIDEVIVATSTNKDDDIVESFLQEHNMNVFRGSLTNVLERFYHCAKQYNADIVIRFTADNALIDPDLIHEAVTLYKNKSVDYLYYKPSLPLGMGIEIFSFSALNKAYHEASNEECLEHVTPYIKNNPDKFRILRYEGCENENNYSALRFTMDTEEDYQFVKTIYNYFGTNDFSYKDVLAALEEHPLWQSINQNITQKTITYQGEKAN